jgi:cysteine synthase
MDNDSQITVAANLKLAKEEASASRPAGLVTLLCDSAHKYLSERFREQA